MLEANKNKGLADVFVLVPSYNHAPFIEECLRSVFHQSLAPKKLLVIDDGSHDDSTRIIERVLKDCPFDSELIARENRGLCFTLNQGLELSSGEYFAYIGSDDFWTHEFLAARTEMLERRPNAVLGYGHAYFVDGNGEIFDCTAEHRESWANYPDGNAREMLLKGIAPVSSTVFYRRSALEKVRWNERSRLEDYEMYLQLMNLGDFAFDPSVLSAWRHHHYNTSKDDLLMLREVLAAQQRNIDILGVSPARLAKAQSETTFGYAKILLQHGQKSEALRLAKKSWRGAKIFDLIKFTARMFVPMAVVRFRKSLRKKKLIAAPPA